MGELYPLWMLKYLPNMPACHIGIRYDARGPNNTISQGDVSSLMAIAEAADVIRRDLADVMIVGGTGSRINVSDLMWHRGARVSCNGTKEPAAICRPFDRERSGIVFGEGAAQLVLESRDHAERRGVRPLARVAGSAVRYESAVESLRPTGDAIRRAIAAALAAAKLESYHIGHVNAHGNSTREDDPDRGACHSRDARRRPGHRPQKLLRQSRPRQRHGRARGQPRRAAQGVIPPTLNFETPDPDCPVNVVRRKPQRPENRTFIKLSHNAWATPPPSSSRHAR